MRFAPLLLSLFCLPLFAHGFGAGTAVKTPHGHKEIQLLIPGDVVMSCDELKRCVEDKVIAVSEENADGYVEVLVGDEIIKASSTQSFYVASKNEWVETKDLNPSDVLVRSTGHPLPLKTIRWVQEKSILFNLTVATHHNYYVGESEILAHNVFFLIPLIPILAWGGGAGIAVGIGAGTAATIATTAAVAAVGVGIGVAIDQAAKHSNTPVDRYGSPQNQAFERALQQQRMYQQQQQRPYTPDRELPNGGRDKPLPDVDAPHSQLGRRGSGEGYPQTREWGYGADGELKPTRDIDWTDHGSPDHHANPHQHDRGEKRPDGTYPRAPGKPIEQPK